MSSFLNNWIFPPMGVRETLERRISGVENPERRMMLIREFGKANESYLCPEGRKVVEEYMQRYELSPA